MWSIEWTDSLGRHHFKMVRNESVVRSYASMLTAQGHEVQVSVVADAARHS
jgi:hypothetical protein